ncbi:hypothetical protein WAK64_01100 [Bacillus spongiae]|uniref:Membrane protein YszA n=1 Tax=Bacillus spongiae TaxID=2683610 RepID=A0ABU8H8T8_9BACI
MRKKYNPYLLHPWLKTFRSICAQLIIPFTVFQLIRTFLLPTTFDVLLLLIFAFIAIAIKFEWI